MATSVLSLGPGMFLMIYRNIFGPIKNITVLNWLLKLHLFGEHLNIFLFLEFLLIWYITEILFKTPIEMDDVGMAECLMFFNISLSVGLTFLTSSTSQIYYNLLTRYYGLPLDTSNVYLTKIG